MKTALVFLAPGFEEIEAITTIDVLRRAGIDVGLLAVGCDLNVTGAHGIEVMADECIEDVSLFDLDALILPGGWPGAENLSKSELLTDALRVQDALKGVVAAICAAPFVLGTHNILNGHEATCYPSFEKYLHGATFVEQGVVVSENIITARGPAYSIDFALAIVEALVGKEKADEVAKGMLHK